MENFIDIQSKVKGMFAEKLPDIMNLAMKVRISAHAAHGNEPFTYEEEGYDAEVIACSKGIGTFFLGSWERYQRERYAVMLDAREEPHHIAIHVRTLFNEEAYDTDGDDRLDMECIREAQGDLEAASRLLGTRFYGDIRDSGYVLSGHVIGTALTSYSTWVEDPAYYFREISQWWEDLKILEDRLKDEKEDN